MASSTSVTQQGASNGVATAGIQRMAVEAILSGKAPCNCLPLSRRRSRARCSRSRTTATPGPTSRRCTCSTRAGAPPLPPPPRCGWPYRLRGHQAVWMQTRSESGSERFQAEKKQGRSTGLHSGFHIEATAQTVVHVCPTRAGAGAQTQQAVGTLSPAMLCWAGCLRLAAEGEW